MTKSIFKFTNGTKVLDSVTGTKGTIIARCQFLNGCIQYQIQDKDPTKEIWIDEQRLKIEESPPKEPTPRRWGGGFRSHPV